MKLLAIFLVLYLTKSVDFAAAWEDDQLEVFDVVEEVEQNFYQLMGVPQNANASDIKRAFRKLSLLLHPDKSDAPDADVQFRNLVAVYDVLKDPNKRKHYNEVLLNGLPNWRSGVYYYRYVRKMGLLEIAIVLFVLITIGQYLCSWAAYLEKRYTYQQVLGSKLQKLAKKSKKTKMEVPNLADILEKIPAPSIWNTLPFQLPRWTVSSIVGIPSTIRCIKELIEEKKRLKKLEEEEALAQEEVPEPEPVTRGPRRRRQAFTPQELKNSEKTASESNDSAKNANDFVAPPEKPIISGGLWTDDDLLELIKLVKKYPGGTSDRWEKIADSMCRTTAEVTYMAKKIKDEGIRPGRLAEEEVVEELPKKVKTRAEQAVPETTSEWSQAQQKAFEIALAKFPKGSCIDRWEKIAKQIQGKTKEECQLRYRQLVEIVKKKQNES